VEVHAQVLHGADGRLLGTTGTLSDFTDTRRFEAEREARQKAEDLLRLKTAFLNNMSHEIRTPLTGILGFAEILAEEVEEPLRDFARRIEKSGNRLLDTLNSVLDLAQLEGNGVTLHLEALDLAGEVREAVQLLAPLAVEKGLALHAAVPPEALPARLDRSCLHRILTNLIGNAIKFTPHGRITVTARGAAGEVAFDVSDTGIGIGEAFLPHLFDEFWQESAGHGRSHEGSGLGLAITKRLVDLMQGRVAVESRQGVGTTFTVAFPQAVPAPCPAAVPAAVDPSAVCS
jgi:signal transduction histidine kinase